MPCGVPVRALGAAMTRGQWKRSARQGGIGWMIGGALVVAVIVRFVLFP